MWHIETLLLYGVVCKCVCVMHPLALFPYGLFRLNICCLTFVIWFVPGFVSMCVSCVGGRISLISLLSKSLCRI